MSKNPNKMTRKNYRFFNQKPGSVLNHKNIMFERVVQQRSATVERMTLTPEVKYVTEVPNSLKQLARLAVRGFYSIEDALIIDMLVRNPCMKEDDIAELLRFEKKQMRARISKLRSDKFIQMGIKMEPRPNRKAQKVNYYFINYKKFVNVVKYKLDQMRKRMETEERDATSRASFKCPHCRMTFTDLEADQLFNFTTQEFRCTFCGSLVEEDSASLPRKDSRLMLARFNEQLQPLYDLLREVEGIKLAPEILEPEPVDIDTIRGVKKPNSHRPDGQAWSGEATRNQGFVVEDTCVDVNIGDDDMPEAIAERKAYPVWMTESTVITEDNVDNADAILNEAAQSSLRTPAIGGSDNHSRKENEDIMSVLLQHEKQPEQLAMEAFGSAYKAANSNAGTSDSDSDDDEFENANIFNIAYSKHSESEGEDDDVPTVHVGGWPYAIDKINTELIAQMTTQEKEDYVYIYQQHFSHIYD